LVVSFCALLWTHNAWAGPDDGVVAGAAPNAPDSSPAEASQSPAVANPGPAPEITVEGRRRAHVEGFTQAEVRALPGALGDPLRAVEALPGVTPALSGVPYFFVRGAPPGDVGYFFDGIRLPALFHALGGPSVIHPGLIETVELYPGPYPVEYGRLAAAAVVAHATEPSPMARGEVAVRATDSSALLDTPLGESTNLTLAGRYSYANPVLHLFASNLNVEYWDYQARVVHQLSDRDRVRVLVFGAHDSLTQADDNKVRTLYGIDFQRAALRFEHQLPHGSVALQVLAGSDRSFAENGDVEVQDLSTEGRVDVTQVLTRNFALRAGMSVNHDLYKLDASKLDDAEKRTRYLEQFPARLDSAGGMYLAFDADVGSGLLLTPGIRVDAYVSQGNTVLSCDPRVSAEYRVSSHLTLQSALGIAHQPPANALPAPGLNPTLGQGLQTGVQQSYGFRLRLPSDVSLAVTLFQNALFNVTDSAGLARLGDADKSVSQDTRGLGWSRGVELLLRRSLTRKLGGFLSYTLSSSKRAVGRAEGPSAYDRRHVLGAALGYDWGHGFRSGARVTFYTGIPADVAYLEAARDPPRTTAFYRVDLRSEKRFLLGDSRYFSLVFEIVNATLNREVLQASCDAYVCKEQRVGPVTIPNFGIEAGF
jgi:TonB dependent receptor/TonB-dependent Receptor Plug Domain